MMSATQLVPVGEDLAVEVMKFFKESWKTFWAMESTSYVRIAQYLIILLAGICR